jgi:DNA repair protein RadC
LENGIESLSTPELLAILLGTGIKGKSVLILAQELLHQFNGIDGLLEATVEELMQIKGIGKAKAICLKAAFGIALRVSKPSSSLSPITSAAQAFEIAKQEMKNYKQEMLLVFLRDVKGRIFHKETIGIGTLSHVLVHPREVFYPAVRHRANSLILAHNHPSGDPTPSKADLTLTQLLYDSSIVMGIGLDDHLIIGNHGFVSLRERGFLSKSKKY